MIDCDTCVARRTSTCDDCVVSFLLSRDGGDAVVIPIGELAALRTMGEAGLVPRLRHRRRTG